MKRAAKAKLPEQNSPGVFEELCRSRAPFQFTVVCCLQMDRLRIREAAAYLYGRKYSLREVSSTAPGKPVLRGPELALFYI